MSILILFNSLSISAVSYTHLDVYKRQEKYSAIVCSEILVIFDLIINVSMEQTEVGSEIGGHKFFMNVRIIRNITDFSKEYSVFMLTIFY